MRVRSRLLREETIANSESEKAPFNAINARAKTSSSTNSYADPATRTADPSPVNGLAGRELTLPQMRRAAARVCGPSRAFPSRSAGVVHHELDRVGGHLE